MRYDFEHYLLAGHGRAYMIAKTDPERYRCRINSACRKDYSFDMQTEGSRAFLTYDLVSLFADPSPFIETVKDSYCDHDVDADWREICYLTDLLDLFDQRKVIIGKYKKLEEQLYGDLPEEELNLLCQSFEYLAIKLIEGQDIKVVWNVVNDIGKWFLSRNEDPHELASHFLWFKGDAEEALGEDGLLKYDGSSEGIKEYIRIMSQPFEYERKDKVSNATAEMVLSWLREEPEITRLEMMYRGLMTMSGAEALKLAEQFSVETDPGIKAAIASVFTSGKYLWPLDISILTDCSSSEDKRLVREVNEALSLLTDERLHDHAMDILKTGFDPGALKLLINNIKKSDESFILGFLEELPIDEDDECEWHGIVSAVNGKGDDPEMPDSLLLWAYEASLCSWCREGIVEKLISRGLMTDDMKEEIRYDADLDIRDLADK
ncbi:MAG: hypothetical protein J6W36_09480 [Clostridiales bacterium]|nr:hypothetical protein [Clostridiales bacterium]